MSRGRRDPNDSPWGRSKEGSGRSNRGPSQEKKVERGASGPRGPPSASHTGKAPAAHGGGGSSSRMQPLKSARQRPLPTTEPSPSPIPRSPSGGPPTSWAALLGGTSPIATAAPVESSPPSHHAAEALSSEEPRKSLSSVNVASSADFPPAVELKQQQTEAPSKISPTAPLHPAPWVKPAAAAPPAQSSVIKESPTPSRNSPGSKGGSLPTTPRSFSFQRSSGVVITHEAPPVAEHHHHHHQSQEHQPGRINSDEKKQNNAPASTCSAPAPALSWAAKAKAAANNPVAPPPARPKPSPSPKPAASVLTPPKKAQNLPHGYASPSSGSAKGRGGGGGGGAHLRNTTDSGGSSDRKERQISNENTSRRQERKINGAGAPLYHEKKRSRAPIESTFSKEKEPSAPLVHPPPTRGSDLSSSAEFSRTEAPSSSPDILPVAPPVAPLPHNEALEMLCGSLASWQLLSDHKNPPKERVQPRGIKNPGNLCFVNAVLQGLMGSPSFCRLMLALQGAVSVLDPKTFPVLSAMAAVASEFQNSPAGAVLGRDAKEKANGGGMSNSTSGGSTSKRDFKLAANGSIGKGGDDNVAPRQQDSRKAPAVTVLGGRPVASAVVMELIHRFSPRQQDRAEGQVEQEDAHEFLHFLLDKMHSELVALRKEQGGAAGQEGTNAGGNGRGGPEEEEEDGGVEDGWLVKSGKKAVRQQEVSAAPSGEASIVTAVFEGKLATSVACAGAPNSVTVHPFQIVEIPIFSDAIRSIEDAIDALTGPEVLEDYKPSNGAAPQQAAKTERFLQLPGVLILHLMRFQFTGRSAKVNKFISFEPRLAMRASWLASGSSDRGAVYDLVATVAHHGKSISSGHYTADVIQPDGKWLRFDDSDVYLVGQQEVMAERPYLLVYQRQQRGS